MSGKAAYSSPSLASRGGGGEVWQRKSLLQNSPPPQSKSVPQELKNTQTPPPSQNSLKAQSPSLSHSTKMATTQAGVKAKITTNKNIRILSIKPDIISLN